MSYPFVSSKKKELSFCNIFASISNKKNFILRVDDIQNDDFKIGLLQKTSKISLNIFLYYI